MLIWLKKQKKYIYIYFFFFIYFSYFINTCNCSKISDAQVWQWFAPTPKRLNVYHEQTADSLVKSRDKYSEKNIWVTFSCEIRQTSAQEKEKGAGLLIFLDYF